MSKAAYKRTLASLNFSESDVLIKDRATGVCHAVIAASPPWRTWRRRDRLAFLLQRRERDLKRIEAERKERDAIRRATAATLGIDPDTGAELFPVPVIAPTSDYIALVDFALKVRRSKEQHDQFMLSILAPPAPDYVAERHKIAHEIAADVFKRDGD